MSQEQWTRLAADKPGSIERTNLVAALATLGVRVKTERVIDDRTGKDDLFYMLATEFIFRGGKMRTKQLMNLCVSGELEKADPCHPLLDCLRGLHNAHCVLDWMKLGMPHHLAQQACGARTIYQAGAAVAAFPRNVTTRRLSVVAALGILGIPLLDVQGSDNHRIFVITDIGFPLHGDHSFSSAVIHEHRVDRASYSAGKILRDFRQQVGQKADGSPLSLLERDQPEHPFLYAYMARENRQRLLAHLDRAVPLIMLRSTRSNRMAFVHRDAEDSAWEQAEDHTSI